MRFEPDRTIPVRIDSGVETGSDVSIHFDPMLAKVIAHAPTREEAALKLAAALQKLRIHGPITNRDFLVNVLAAKYMVTSLGDATVGSSPTPGSFGRAVLVSLLLLAFGFLAGALTGLVIHVTRIADIIVTLAMLFVWAGAALAVLEVPGGGAPVTR